MRVYKDSQDMQYSDSELTPENWNALKRTVDLLLGAVEGLHARIELLEKKLDDSSYDKKW